MNYTSITAGQREEMLAAIGASSIDDLFAVIPEKSRFKGDLDLPPALSELELQREIARLSSKNRHMLNSVSFMGAGAYDHFIPSFIDQIVNRGEILTAYTPYQAEASQGSLQAFFEFQTQIARLTGLDIANASLYEGASACNEAALLALNTTGKRRVLIADTVHPDYRKVVETGLSDLPAELVVVKSENGRLTPDAVKAASNNDTACLIVQSPNFFGQIEDWEGLFSAFQSTCSEGHRPLNVAVINPIACALLKSPGACGADVACGEGQPLGVPLQFGGPYLGLFAAKKEFMRRMPGRLIGQTEDDDGRRAFSLVLQTREQHIRGAKATSNICTNQGLLAMRATMYMTAMGPQGIREVAEQCWHKAHYLAKKIGAIPGYSLRYTGEFFNEFVIKCPGPVTPIIEHCKKHGFLPGVALHGRRLGRVGAPDELLIAVTEKRTREELDAFTKCLSEAPKA